MKIRPKSRSFIKICGLATKSDLRLCATAGASAVGILLVGDDHDQPNTDQLDFESVKSLMSGFPKNLDSVILSKSTIFEFLGKICSELRPKYLQIQGNVSIETIRCLKQSTFSTKIVKKISIAPESSVENLSATIEKLRATNAIHAFLLDTARTSGGRGGTGSLHDWSISRELVENYPDCRFVVAGGLDPDNVAGAINYIGPWGVDVMSGVSLSPGVKDPDRVANFVSLRTPVQ